MDDITIPPEVVEAVTRVIDRYMEGGITYHEGETPAHAAIRAAIAAWPGMMTERRARCDAVVLPFNLDADIMQESKE